LTIVDTDNPTKIAHSTDILPSQHRVLLAIPAWFAIRRFGVSTFPTFYNAANESRYGEKRATQQQHKDAARDQYQFQRDHITQQNYTVMQSWYIKEH
jgi:hypothetical protein